MTVRPLKPWIVTVRHDAGTIRIQVWTETQAAAIESIMSSEGCPRRAILSVKAG